MSEIRELIRRRVPNLEVWPGRIPHAQELMRVSATTKKGVGRLTQGETKISWHARERRHVLLDTDNLPPALILTFNSSPANRADGSAPARPGDPAARLTPLTRESPTFPQTPLSPLKHANPIETGKLCT